MTLGEFDIWARATLEFEPVNNVDSSLNGIQVGRDSDEITRMAFAVDACMDSFQRAKKEGAQALFVHHGLFWGPNHPLTGVFGERVRYLMNENLALYACHLPLDKHSKLGNNAGMAEALNLINVQPFGMYKGHKIGCKGFLKESMNLDSVVKKLFGSWENGIEALRFGPLNIKSIGIISGGGPREVSQAIEEDLDLYITGDAAHEIYHLSQEARINVLFAGHYLSEVFGIHSMAKRVEEELKIESIYIDLPTGY